MSGVKSLGTNKHLFKSRLVKGKLDFIHVAWDWFITSSNQIPGICIDKLLTSTSLIYIFYWKNKYRTRNLCENLPHYFVYEITSQVKFPFDRNSIWNVLILYLYLLYLHNFIMKSFFLLTYFKGDGIFRLLEIPSVSVSSKVIYRYY